MYHLNVRALNDRGLTNIAPPVSSRLVTAVILAIEIHLIASMECQDFEPILENCLSTTKKQKIGLITLQKGLLHSHFSRV